MGVIHQTRGKGGVASDASSSPLDSLAAPVKPLNDQLFSTVDDAVVGLSKRLGLEVDAHFVRAFFVKDLIGTIDLPPKPRMDPKLVEQVAALIQPVNQSPRDESAITSFLEKTFNAAAERRLSSYELQLLEFAVKHKDTIELQFDYRSKQHAHEMPLSGDKRVVFGARHHWLDREYTPQEAFSTFMHEISHSRETTYGIRRRQSATGIIFSEVNANIYGASGNIRIGIKETASNYEEQWKELNPNLPGFAGLGPVDQYRYLAIMCTQDQPPEVALVSHADELKEAFPKLASVIDKRCERVLKLQEARLPWIDDMGAPLDEED
jgi:hypothetical protein